MPPLRPEFDEREKFCVTASWQNPRSKAKTAPALVSF